LKLDIVVFQYQFEFPQETLVFVSFASDLYCRIPNVNFCPIRVRFVLKTYTFMVLMAGLGQTFGEAAAYMRTDYATSIGKTESEVEVIHTWYTRFYEIASVEDDISREVKGTYWIWFQEALRLEPQKYLNESACPTLAITGEKDRQANPGQNLPLIEKGLKEGICEDYTIEEMPGLNHLFQTAETGAVSEYERIPEIIAPMALETISEWIIERVDL
jgi:hypothetical protein